MVGICAVQIVGADRGTDRGICTGSLPCRSVLVFQRVIQPLKSASHLFSYIPIANSGLSKYRSLHLHLAL